ncbi:MAG: isoprenylcysteine carboxylmethyltransferase family protein [Candidatus Omnitrophica bacterium]|jgi:protein-S-isoprenylcysteine O-methyltransferase Ste14|nr:isoprenylcysteine carboxylmethyltransferase family protein [Candidatus Omnitrophota bacterium]MDD5690408.1 isoprenylcysteine carboxylmethyltransferase family protein [Candidatus Omnitrophota bacterium]
MKKRLKINGIIMACAAILVVFFPSIFFRNNISGGIEEYVEILGFSCILLGQIIRVSARGYKAEHSCESQALIQDGPYQIVRNPMYLGIFLIGLGVVLAVFKWWAVVIFIAVFIIRYIKLIYKEEKKLLAVFPESYKDYCRKVPRILPSLFTIIKLDISEYLPIKISWFKKEIGSILALLLLTLLVESWEDITREGFGFYIRQSSWLFLTFVLFVIFIILLSNWTTKRDGKAAGKS